MEITLHESVGDIPAAEWDACACAGQPVPRDPFTTHRFLLALERSGSVGDGTGWHPRPMVLRDRGQAVAVAPLYLKGHSRGEYIFDHAWAEAWTRAGGDYYPKLQVAVPFTPATGRRILARPDWQDRAVPLMLDTLGRIAEENGLSSAHVTFCTEAEARKAPPGWLHRRTLQFHWENRGHGDTEAFMATLASRKRKAIRKERATARAFGGSIEQLTGDALRPDHWDAFWTFYQDTGARKWGTPYLTRAFFDEIQDHMRDDVLLVLASRDGHPVAGALNFIGADTLYGRWWGCIEEHPCLHFELCYHQAIDWAIAHGLSRVEAGAQGEHKLARGYMPSMTHSLHLLPDPGFARAVAAHLEHEDALVMAEMAELAAMGPYAQRA